MSTFSKLQQKSPAYVELLERSLYEQMMWVAYSHKSSVLINSSLHRTAGPEILPSQTYDYDALTSLALKSSQLANWRPETQVETDKGLEV